MGGPADGVSFRYHRERHELIAIAAIVFGMIWVLVAWLSVAWWFGAASALMFGAVIVTQLRQAYAREAPLQIGPDGLKYTPFADRTIPWSEISRVMIVRIERGYVVWGRQKYKYDPRQDGVHFDVRDWSLYPKGAGRWFLRSAMRVEDLPVIPIRVWSLEGCSTDAVVSAIARFWDGKIEEKSVKRR
jgi:hypothetical protein